MFKLLKDYKRVQKLLKEDDKRREIEKQEQLKLEKIREELSLLRETDINYLKKLCETDIKNLNINLASLYRELNRAKLSLYLTIPTLYIEIYKEKPFAIFDSVYIRDTELSSHEHSITEIEELFSKALERGCFPPEKINLDCFEDACYYTLYNSTTKDLASLNKLLTFIQNQL